MRNGRAWEALRRLPRPKVAFFDLDGTLVGADGAISPSSQAAITRLQEEGVRVALATGRPYFGATEVVRSLNIREVSLFFSGALLVRPTDNWILSCDELPRAVVRTLLAEARKLGIHAEWYTGSDYFIEIDSPFAVMHAHYLGRQPSIAQFEKFPESERLLKVVFMTDRPETLTRAREIAARCSETNVAVGVGAAHPGISFVNVTSTAASREGAFERLLAYYRVAPEEVIAMGDAEADLPFLQRAGYGIAMGNAPLEVQERVKLVTESISDEGVARAIGRILGEECLR